MNNPNHRPQTGEREHNGDEDLSDEKLPRRSEPTEQSRAGSNVSQDRPDKRCVLGYLICFRLNASCDCRVLGNRRIVSDQVFDDMSAKLIVGKGKHVFGFQAVAPMEIKKPPQGWL
jgi:hypothetical protein